jgi:calcium-dependent protein kinase
VGNFDDHYVITGKIGEGSFGSVYKVRHKVLKLDRALKIIKKRSNANFSSFEEIEVLMKLDHPNILKIYEFYESIDSYYIITEIFDGKELFDVILE